MVLIAITYPSGDEGTVNTENVVRMDDLDLADAAKRLYTADQDKAEIEKSLDRIGQGRTIIHMKDGTYIYARESQKELRFRANSLLAHPETGLESPGVEQGPTAGEKLTPTDALRSAFGDESVQLRRQRRNKISDDRPSP